MDLNKYKKMYKNYWKIKPKIKIKNIEFNLFHYIFFDILTYNHVIYTFHLLLNKQKLNNI